MNKLSFSLQTISNFETKEKEQKHKFITYNRQMLCRYFMSVFIQYEAKTEDDI